MVSRGARASAPRSAVAHYAKYDNLLAMQPAVAGSGGSALTPQCPEPKAFSAAQEIFWLAVVTRQLGWPWPQPLGRRLSAASDAHAFTVDQLRYLLRRDDTVGALEAAAAGVRLQDHRRDLAERLLQHIRTRQGTARDDPRYGRWPYPSESESKVWEAEKNAFFATQPVGKALTAEEEAAWICFLFAQMGWPMPSLVTRIFPRDWVTRKLDPSFVTMLLGPKDDIDILDIVLCGGKVRNLTASMIEGAWRRHEAFVQAKDDAAKRGLEVYAPILNRVRPMVAAAEQDLILAMFDTAEANLERLNEFPRYRISLDEFIVKRRLVLGELETAVRRTPPRQASASRAADGNQAQDSPTDGRNDTAVEGGPIRQALPPRKQAKAVLTPAALAGVAAQQAAMTRREQAKSEREQQTLAPAPATAPDPEPVATEAAQPIPPTDHVAQDQLVAPIPPEEFDLEAIKADPKRRPHMFKLARDHKAAKEAYERELQAYDEAIKARDGR